MITKLSKKPVFMEGEDTAAFDPDEEYQQLCAEAEVEESALQLPRGYFSVSQYKTYMRCPMQYKFRYVDSIISPPNIAMIEGSAIHKGLEVMLREKQKTANTPPLSVGLDAWHERFKDAVKEINWKNETKSAGKTRREIEEDLRQRDKTFIEVYAHQHLPNVYPKAVEKRFWVLLGDLNIPTLGFIDLIQTDDKKNGTPGADNSEILVDHKVTLRRKSQNEANTDEQLTVYAKVAGVRKVAFNNLVKSKKPAIHTVFSERNETHFNRALYVFTEIAKLIDKGIFPPTSPGNYTCSPRYCGYYGICHRT